MINTSGVRARPLYPVVFLSTNKHKDEDSRDQTLWKQWGTTERVGTYKANRLHTHVLPIVEGNSSAACLQT